LHKELFLRKNEVQFDLDVRQDIKWTLINKKEVCLTTLYVDPPISNFIEIHWAVLEMRHDLGIIRLFYVLGGERKAD
jgi:hypothetical protein